MKILAVIPARYGATRLPGKPLAMISGKPMIQHVYERAASASGIDNVIVATDDERIVSACKNFGAAAIMTPELPSGTDRVAYVARQFPDYDGVLNVQGDEPAIESATVAAVADALRHNNVDISTAVVPLTNDAADLNNPNAVKAVVAKSGIALYFSRSPVPFIRNTEQAQGVQFRHLGLYGFRRDILLKLTELKPSPLELTESLEQLRWLEAGYKIFCVKVESRSIGVDTPDDLKTVEALLQNERA